MAAGACVEITGATVGGAGVAVGETGDDVWTTGDADGSIGEIAGLTVAGFCASTLAGSSSLTLRPDVVPIPTTVALIGPSGALVAGRSWPSIYISSPGHNTAGAMITTRGPEVPPMGAGSFSIILNTHSSLEGGTVIR